jgi:hypothetical protein
MKYIWTILFTGTVFASGRMNEIDQSGEPCNETASIIKKIVSAKIEYEEAEYRKEKNMAAIKRRYSALVKLFKEKGKVEDRRECLRQMIIKDSISPTDSIIELTYVPLTSSKMNECSVLSYSDFLKTMLLNLNDLDNDSTILCTPEVIKKSKKRIADVDKIKKVSVSQTDSKQKNE